MENWKYRFRLTQEQNNGGIVVRMEKDADHLIADHARLKSAPANSLSWHFIEKSVQNGQLEDPEDHRIGPQPSAPRLAGSSAPTRATRTKFTAADDAIIKQWVRDQGGIYAQNINGNKKWQQLEALVRAPSCRCPMFYGTDSQ